jgi:hypothetical protein
MEMKIMAIEFTTYNFVRALSSSLFVIVVSITGATSRVFKSGFFFCNSRPITLFLLIVVLCDQKRK